MGPTADDDESRHGVSNNGDTPPGPPPPDLSNDTLTGFSGWKRIGRGGDAIVYRATQDDLDRDVAIKVLTVDDEESVRRFIREVQLMVSLGRQHPNIAKVLQIGTSSMGRPCIVMDYYELGSLDQRLARTGPFTADEVIAVGTVIADALAYAHSRGVLHRDVKPQNILILPTSYVLADFGIARLIDSAHTASTDRFSYRHASPQVLDGCSPSESDDIFSLGATMFHLLDGKPPFTTTQSEPDAALAYIGRVRTTEPRRLTRTDVPEALVALIERCLRKDRRERFGSAAELRDALAGMRTSWLGVGSTLPAAPLPALTNGDGPAGWVRVPGTAHSAADLTSMRLTHATEPSAATAAGAKAEPAVTDSGHRAADTPDDRDDRPRPRLAARLGIGLAGVALGVVLVLLWALAWPQPPRSATPSLVTTPSAPQERPSNPDLAPRNMKAEFVDDRVRITWERPVDHPRRYLIGVSPNREAETVLVDESLFDATTAEVTVDASWPQVCVAVIAERQSETGFDQECLTR